MDDENYYDQSSVQSQSGSTKQYRVVNSAGNTVAYVPLAKSLDLARTKKDERSELMRLRNKDGSFAFPITSFLAWKGGFSSTFTAGAVVFIVWILIAVASKMDGKVRTGAIISIAALVLFFLVYDTPEKKKWSEIIIARLAIFFGIMVAFFWDLILGLLYIMTEMTGRPGKAYVNTTLSAMKT